MRLLEKLEEGLLSLLMAAMVLVTFVQVVARYFFNYSFTWALEATTVLFAWLIFIGMSYGVRVGVHIGIDLLVKRLGPGLARGVGIVTSALCTLYAAVLTAGSWQYLVKIHEVGILMQDIPVPQWMPRVVLPIGFAILTLRFGAILWRMLSGKSARLLGDEAEDALKMRDEMREDKP